MWYICKNPHDYGRDFMKNYRQDLIAMVNRDYNHASVILYSIGNEITEPAYAKAHPIHAARHRKGVSFGTYSRRPHGICSPTLRVIAIVHP